jgi:hypothetical protein
VSAYRRRERLLGKENFIAIFQMYAKVFHCDFSNVSQGIFKYIPHYFIAIFQMYARVFHCDFSNVGQGSFKCNPGYFIATFQM